MRRAQDIAQSCWAEPRPDLATLASGGGARSQVSRCETAATVAADECVESDGRRASGGQVRGVGVAVGGKGVRVCDDEWQKSKVAPNGNNCGQQKWTTSNERTKYSEVVGAVCAIGPPPGAVSGVERCGELARAENGLATEEGGGGGGNGSSCATGPAAAAAAAAAVTKTSSETRALCSRDENASATERERPAQSGAEIGRSWPADSATNGPGADERLNLAAGVGRRAKSESAAEPVTATRRRPKADADAAADGDADASADANAASKTVRAADNNNNAAAADETDRGAAGRNQVQCGCAMASDNDSEQRRPPPTDRGLASDERHASDRAARQSAASGRCGAQTKATRASNRQAARGAARGALIDPRDNDYECEYEIHSDITHNNNYNNISSGGGKISNNGYSNLSNFANNRLTKSARATMGDAPAKWALASAAAAAGNNNSNNNNHCHYQLSSDNQCTSSSELSSQVRRRTRARRAPPAPTAGARYAYYDYYCDAEDDDDYDYDYDYDELLVYEAAPAEVYDHNRAPRNGRGGGGGGCCYGDDYNLNFEMRPRRAQTAPYAPVWCQSDGGERARAQVARANTFAPRPYLAGRGANELGAVAASASAVVRAGRFAAATGARDGQRKWPLLAPRPSRVAYRSGCALAPAPDQSGVATAAAAAGRYRLAARLESRSQHRSSSSPTAPIMATTATTTTTPTTLGARQLNSIARNYEPANSARVANEDVDDDDDEFARRTIDPASVTTLVAQSVGQGQARYKVGRERAVRYEYGHYDYDDDDNNAFCDDEPAEGTCDGSDDDDDDDSGRTGDDTSPVEPAAQVSERPQVAHSFLASYATPVRRKRRADEQRAPPPPPPTATFVWAPEQSARRHKKNGADPPTWSEDAVSLVSPLRHALRPGTGKRVKSVARQASSCINIVISSPTRATLAASRQQLRSAARRRNRLAAAKWCPVAAAAESSAPTQQTQPMGGQFGACALSLDSAQASGGGGATATATAAAAATATATRATPSEAADLALTTTVQSSNTASAPAASGREQAPEIATALAAATATATTATTTTTTAAATTTTTTPTTTTTTTTRTDAEGAGSARATPEECCARETAPNDAPTCAGEPQKKGPSGRATEALVASGAATSAGHSIMRPVKLKNLITGEQTVDNLHNKYRGNSKQHSCNELRCLGSLINPKPVENKVRPVDEIWSQARDFIDNFYASIKRLNSPAHKTRLAEIETQLKTNQTYHLKETELIYGAKLAWRNASRCIGRIQWSKLQVFDARFTKNADEMFEALCNHIKYATNKGSLRSAITIMPQRVKSTKNDWRIWNSQLIGFAGYRDKETGKVVGDPQNADFTDICLKLGWQGKGTRFDILPIVLSANGCPPQLYPLPEDLVLRVKIKHPKYKWFEELGLEWYALPAVANMMLDVGGLQFTAAPFSGWYMVTEIGTRDLGDPNRYNMLEVVAQRMGLNTVSNNSLWKDYAIVELNLAVLDSFQQAGVTIVDHHTASETFMTHFSNEQRLRAGCPADWVWLVPPTAGTSTQVFHQEMVNYHLLPNYEYMEPVWKHYDWTEWERAKQMKLDQADKARDSTLATLANLSAKAKQQNGSDVSPLGLVPATKHKVVLSGVEQIANGNGLTSLIGTSNAGSNGEMTPRKLRFKEIARAVKFTSKLFGKALSRRIKATILYATETGKSERFANKLAQIFSCAFNVHLMSMSDYDMTLLEHEALLLIVTSTFGNGDPPENGELFAKHLAAIKLTGDTSPDIDSINSVSTNPFFQMLSEDHKDGVLNSELDHDSSDDSNESMPTQNGGDLNACLQVDSKRQQRANDKARKQNMDKQENQTLIRPLSNVRFAVFALGSTAYPHFCAFGRYVDQTLSELGAERILKCTCGDELCGQEKAFNEWSNQAFKIACDVFCLTDSLGPMDDRPEITWNPCDVRFAPVELISDSTHSDGSTPLASHNLQQQSQQQQQQLFGSNHSTTNQQLRAEDVLTNKTTIVNNLIGMTNKKIVPFNVIKRIDLHKFIPEENLQTLRIDLENDSTPIEILRDQHKSPSENSAPVDSINPSSSDMSSSLSTSASAPTTTANTATTPDTTTTAANTTTPANCTTTTNKMLAFEPGDHVGIFPVNDSQMVDKIIQRMRQNILSDPDSKLASFDFDQVYTILVKRENMDLTPAAHMPNPAQAGTPATISGAQHEGEDSWIPHDRLPITSIRDALTRYLDITNPPNQDFLSILSRQTSDPDERKRLQQMARNFTVYEEWKNKRVPSLLTVLEEFKTIRFEPALVTQIPLIKPRFYSISGTSITLTLGVVRFKTASGEPREGLCSNYLNRIPINPKTYLYGYIRSAHAFHMPQDKAIPMILISAGTGIAPFRSFWQQRYEDMYKAAIQNASASAPGPLSGSRIRFGSIDLYFGCRNSNYILYREELDDMQEAGVLSSVNLAFSRPLDCDVFEESPSVNGVRDAKFLPIRNASLPKSGIASTRQARKRVYVQDKLLEHSERINKLITIEGAHVYVCGDVAMADGVYKTLAAILSANKRTSRRSYETIRTLNNDHRVKSEKVVESNRVSSEDGEVILMNLRNLNRYHEDIFGAKQMS